MKYITKMGETIISKVTRPKKSAFTRLDPINPRTAKLFQLTFAAKGGLLQPPWILVFPTEFLREIFHGYSFGVKESKGDS